MTKHLEDLTCMGRPTFSECNLAKGECVAAKGKADAQIPARAGKGARDRKPREERWTEILDVAAKVFAERGYDGTSLQEIANRTGILKGSIYYYINTKADLLGHLLQQAHETGLAQIQPIAENGGPADKRLADMIFSHVNYVCRDRDRTVVFLHERKRLSSEERKKYLGDEHAYRRLFERVIVEGQSEGTIRPELEPKLTALCLMSSLNSIYHWFRGNQQFSAEKISCHLVSTTLSGLAVPK